MNRVVNGYLYVPVEWHRRGFHCEWPNERAYAEGRGCRTYASWELEREEHAYRTGEDAPANFLCDKHAIAVLDDFNI